MAIPPFGAAPTPHATQTKYGTVTLAQIPSAVPLIIANGVTYNVVTNTQVPYGTPIYIQAGGQIYTQGTGVLQWVA